MYRKQLSIQKVIKYAGKSQNRVKKEEIEDFFNNIIKEENKQPYNKHTIEEEDFKAYSTALKERRLKENFKAYPTIL